MSVIFWSLSWLQIQQTSSQKGNYICSRYPIKAWEFQIHHNNGCDKFQEEMSIWPNKNESLMIFIWQVLVPLAFCTIPKWPLRVIASPYYLRFFPSSIPNKSWVLRPHSGAKRGEHFSLIGSVGWTCVHAHTHLITHFICWLKFLASVFAEW